MATYSADLKGQMQRYIDAEDPASDELKNLLQSTTADIRYKLLMEILLDGLSAQQRLDVVKLIDSDGCTALHYAVSEYSTYPYSFDVSIELINKLSDVQLYELMLIQTKRYKRTVFHWAVYYNRADFISRVMAKLTLDQKFKLLSIRNGEGATPADLSIPAICSTVQELKEAQKEVQTLNGKVMELEKAQKKVQTLNGKVTELEKAQKEVQTLNCKVTELERQNKEQIDINAEQTRELREQKNQLDEQKNQLVEQSRVIAEQTRKLEVQDNLLVQQGRDIVEMKFLLEYLEKCLRTPIVTDATGDQEVEDY